jgi:LacI family transcriptional regulator
MKNKSITRNEVAKVAQVSPATVSYVINNGPRPVAPETRKKILDVIQALGYKPNAIARNLRSQRSTTIGLIIPDNKNPYFAEVTRGVEQMASDSQLTVLLCHSDHMLEKELHYVDVMQTERAAGVLWIPATNISEPAIRMMEYGLPHVILDRIVKGAEVPMLVTDIFHGAYLAIKHLIDLGHRRIGYFARHVDHHHSAERLRAYRAALNDSGIELDESLIVGCDSHLMGGYTGVREIINRSPETTAIFAYNDVMAIGALRAAFELGIRVPDDLSIVGFDDIPQAAFTCPALTTISQPKHELGCQGVKLLLDVINQRSNPDLEIQPLPVKLIVRETTKEVKAV